MLPPKQNQRASSQAGEEAPLMPQQSAVYRKYTALQALAASRFDNSLSGRLVLCPGLDSSGTELALCSVISGAGYLAIDPRPQRLKSAVRNGLCNFMVNTLDEALRVLKNELRKRKPLSVGLLGDAGKVLPAMVERGVQPDLLGNFQSRGNQGDSAGALLQFVERGAIVIDFDSGEAGSDSEPAATIELNEQRVTGAQNEVEMMWTPSAPRDLEKIDQRAMAWLPADDTVRRRWLREAPAYFYRQRPLQRVLGLKEDELASFIEALSGEDVRRSLTQRVELRWLRSGEDPDAAASQTAVLEPSPGDLSPG